MSWEAMVTGRVDWKGDSVLSAVSPVPRKFLLFLKALWDEKVNQ